MYPEAYKEWIDLFSDDFVEIWKHERKELQKVSVLLCALQKEMKNIQTNVEVEVTNLKQQLKFKDDLEKQLKSPLIGKKKSPIVNKENNEEKTSNLRACPVARKSPDLFKNIDLNAPSSSTDLSIIDLSISEDDVTSIDGSPTIKKRRKRFKFLPNPVQYNIITECNEMPVTPTNSVRESFKTSLFKTPVQKSDHDLSVIECTPEIVTKRSKTSSRIGDFMSKKKAKSKQSNNSTLTQLFRNAALNKKNEKSGDGDGTDSDETFFDENVEESKMGITELIDYINKDDSSQREDQSENICPELETSSQEVDQFSKGAIFNEEDIQTSSEKPRLISIHPEPVVRGKARKQLQGWSCQQCKNFYGQMKLSPEALQKKMNECSRHRFKYHPREETVPGFWDLSIPPEK